jgi:hypothetical protein
MNVLSIAKQERGPTPNDLEPTYLIEIELSQAESDGVTNNTERATCWRLLQEAIAAWEAAQ